VTGVWERAIGEGRRGFGAGDLVEDGIEIDVGGDFLGFFFLPIAEVKFIDDFHTGAVAVDGAEEGAAEDEIEEEDTRAKGECGGIGGDGPLIPEEDDEGDGDEEVEKVRRMVSRRKMPRMRRPSAVWKM
jgi:hypothetical protein